MTEVDDIMTENEDLQEALLKKDKIIEELERQINTVVRNSEIHMKKNLEKMKIEYELMARSAVSGKMRKMNEYLNSKLKEQESLDADKENMSKGIQIDLEERLSNTSNELTQLKKRLKSKEFMSYICNANVFFYFLESESELLAVRSQLDVKEKMLRSEESLRKQLEVQMNKLANTRICDRMVRGSLDNLARHSLESPVMSPELYTRGERDRNYNQRYLYYRK